MVNLPPEGVNLQALLGGDEDRSVEVLNESEKGIPCKVGNHLPQTGLITSNDTIDIWMRLNVFADTVQILVEGFVGSLSGNLKSR